MDFYCYFKERFAEGTNPYTAITDCQKVVEEMLDNPKIPLCFSGSATVCLLSALEDYAGNGCAVATAYKSTMKLLNDACHRVQRNVQDADRAWLLAAQELEQEASGIPLHDPDYEVWAIDMDTGEDDDELDLDGDESNENAADGPNGMIEAIEDYFSERYDGVAPGTRRPVPDWARCSNWTSVDWIRLQVHKEKIMVVAEMHDLSTMHVVLDAIAAAKAHMSLPSLARKAEITLWIKNLIDELRTGMEEGLQMADYDFP